MPFVLIPTALGVCFLLVWVFIGGMIFRDGQLAIRRDRELNENLLPLAQRHRAAPRGWHVKNNRRKMPARAAS